MSLLRPLHFFVALVVVLVCASVPAQAVSARAATEQVEAELIASVNAVHPGEEIFLGVHQRIIPHWHTYWINPGDSGIATKIAWKLPAGAEAGEIQWPLPSRFQLGSIANYGYEKEVTLLSRMRVPADAKIGSAFPIHATVDWLVCREDCLPQRVELTLVLPVNAAGNASRAGNPLIEAARSRLPVASPWPVRVEIGNEALLMHVVDNEFRAGKIKDVRFYPAQWGRITHSAAQTWNTEHDGIVLTLTPGEDPAKPGEAVEGVLVVSEGGDEIARGYAINTVATAARASSPEIGLTMALALALLGGLILNLMPCVFPVLSIKALSLLRHSQHEPLQARWQGVAYTAGVLVSFAILAAVLIAMKQAGSQIGWGFQFQSPLFVLAVGYVIFAVGLSLSGVMTLGGSVAGVGSSLAEGTGYAGSFFTGVLATVVATPCTAPFMAAAVGYALTQPPLVLLAIFLSLGFGLALPYLVLSAWPALQRRLPRPGRWMDKTKQILAFPMYATAVWLVWVLAQQVGPGGVAVALGGMVIIAFAAWLYDSTRSGSLWLRHIGTIVASLAAATAIVGGLAATESIPLSASPTVPASSATTHQNWQPYSAARLEALRLAGKPVFLNFTAAWCITCLVNERVALGNDAVTKAFHDEGITYLKGDWTNMDQPIRAKLAEFGRSGVPLYVYYPPGSAAEPIILPQLLLPDTIFNAISPIARAVVPNP